MALSKVDLANQVENQLPQNLVANNLPFRNIIINGDMNIAQRGTSTASITSGSTFPCVDRFAFEPNTMGTWTVSQDSDVPSGQGFAKSLKIDCTTADASPAASDYIQLQTKFEGQNLQYLKYGTANAQTLTMSFWVKSNKTGTYNVTLYSSDSGKLIGANYTINSASTWEKKTVTYVGNTSDAFDNDNAQSLRVVWFLGAGTSYTSGTLQTSWTAFSAGDYAAGQTVNLADSTSNDFWITGVQLEAGTTASDFEFLPYDVNLLRCQRYYNKYIGASGSNTGASYDGSFGTFFVYFPTTMRATPTKSSTSGTAFYRFYRLNSNDAITSLGDNGGGKEFMSFNFATTSAAGTGGELGVKSGGVLEADAEL